MRVSLMRLLDSYLGLPLCMLLDFHRRLSLVRAQRRQRDGGVESILVMKFFGMGSLVQARPLLAALRRRYPDAEIGLLTFESNRDVWRLFQLTDHIITIDPSDPGAFVHSWLKAVAELRRRRYGVAIDLEFFTRFSAIMNYLTGAPVRVCFDSPKRWRSSLATRAVPYRNDRHISDSFCQLGAAIDASAAGTVSPPRIGVETVKSLERKLQRAGFPSTAPLVVVNPNASDLCLNRRWPVARYAAIAEWIVERWGVRTCVIGHRDDRSTVDAMLRDVHDAGVHDLCGLLTVGELLALFRRAALVITNDSGPMHLAAAVGTPTVSLFGPETPLLYGPIGNDHEIVYLGIECSPCLNAFNQKMTTCRDNQCMKQIGVHRVRQAVQRAMERAGFNEDPDSVG